MKWIACPFAQMFIGPNKYFPFGWIIVQRQHQRRINEFIIELFHNVLNDTNVIEYILSWYSRIIYYFTISTWEEGMKKTILESGILVFQMHYHFFPVKISFLLSLFNALILYYGKYSIQMVKLFYLHPEISTSLYLSLHLHDFSHSFNFLIL